MAIKFLSGVNIDSNTLFVDDANNRVGIGTGSPQNILHLYGTDGNSYLRWTSDVATTGTRIGYNGTEFRIDQQQNAAIAFRTNSAEAMRITGAGNVGIGTTSPGSYYANNLVVASGAEGGVTIAASGAGENYFMFADGTTGEDRYRGYIGYGHGSDYMRFGTNANERMRITSSGNVGIGTTSPGELLDIRRDTNTGALIRVRNANGGTADYAGLNLGNDLSSNGGGIIIFGSQTTYASPYNPDGTYIYSNRPGGISITSEAAAPVYIATNNSIRLYVASAGNVGIGTTSPSFKLDVNGNTRIGGNSGSNTARLNVGGAANEWVADFQASTTTNQSYGLVVRAGTSSTDFPFYVLDSSSSTAFFAIKGNGNVGIGTASPTARLSLGAASQGYRVTWDNYSNVFSEYSSGDLWLSSNFYGNLGSSGFVTSSTASFGAAGIAVSGTGGGLNGVIKFFVDNAASKTAGDPFTPSERMRITGGGNVLIGTTTDAGIKLDVNGTGRFSGGVLYLGSYSGNPELTLQATNNSWSKINFYDNNNTEGLYIRTDGASYGGTMTFGARWDDDEGKVFFKMFQSSAGAAYDVKIGVNTGSPESMLHLDKSSSSNNISDTPSIIISNKDSTSGTFIGGGIFNNAYRDVSSSSITAGIWFENQNSTGAGALAKQSAVIFGAQSYATGYNTPSERMRITADGNVGIGTTAPSQLLHVSGNIRVTGAYYDSNNEAGTSGQVLSSTGSGTDWITPATTTATSLYDLLPAARVAFNWTGQVVNDTWTTVFSKSSNLLTTGTWMVKMYVSDFTTGGGHYTYTYSGMFTWYQDTTNQGGEQAASEIYLHRMGHAANASVLYLRTTETAAASSGDGLFQIKGNYSNTSNQTIQFQFVKIF